MRRRVPQPMVVVYMRAYLTAEWKQNSRVHAAAARSLSFMATNHLDGVSGRPRCLDLDGWEFSVKVISRRITLRLLANQSMLTLHYNQAASTVITVENSIAAVHVKYM